MAVYGSYSYNFLLDPNYKWNIIETQYGPVYLLPPPKYEEYYIPDVQPEKSQIEKPPFDVRIGKLSQSKGNRCCCAPTPASGGAPSQAPVSPAAPVSLEPETDPRCFQFLSRDCEGIYRVFGVNWLIVAAIIAFFVFKK